MKRCKTNFTIAGILLGFSITSSICLFPNLWDPLLFKIDKSYEQDRYSRKALREAIQMMESGARGLKSSGRDVTYEEQVINNEKLRMEHTTSRNYFHYLIRKI